MRDEKRDEKKVVFLPPAQPDSDDLQDWIEQIGDGVPISLEEAERLGIPVGAPE